MRKALILLGIMLLVIGSNAAYATSIIQDVHNGSVQIHEFQPVGQSFTAKDNWVDTVGVFIAGKPTFPDLIPDSTFTMALYEGEFNFSSDALLASSEIEVGDEYQGWVDLDISTIEFNIGSSYTIGLFNDTKQWNVATNYLNPYLEGAAYWAGKATTEDLKFRVLASEPVPEPSTILLLGAGMLGLVGIGRKKIKK